MIIFLVLLCFNLFCNKNFCYNKKNNKIEIIKYYIIIIGHMLFYIINRVYIILFVYLFIYSLIVNYTKPKTYVYRDVAELYTNIEHRDDPIIEDWKDNYFRHIFLGFNFLLIIFLIIISILRKIIYDILSCGYDINND